MLFDTFTKMIICLDWQICLARIPEFDHFIGEFCICWTGGLKYYVTTKRQKLIKKSFASLFPRILNLHK